MIGAATPRRSARIAGRGGRCNLCEQEGASNHHEHEGGSFFISSNTQDRDHDNGAPQGHDIDNISVHSVQTEHEENNHTEQLENVVQPERVLNNQIRGTGSEIELMAKLSEEFSEKTIGAISHMSYQTTEAVSKMSHEVTQSVSGLSRDILLGIKGMNDSTKKKKSISIEMRVNGKKVKAVMDEESEQSYLSWKWFKRLEEAPELKSNKMLEGEDVQIMGSCMVSIKAGRKVFATKIKVAKIKDEFLIGRDLAPQVQGLSSSVRDQYSSSEEEEEESASDITSDSDGDDLITTGRRKKSAVSVKLPPFTGKERWQVWKGRFEEVAKRRKWGEEDKLDELIPRLQGQAGEFVYAQLSAKTRSKYSKLIAELDARFRVVEVAKTYQMQYAKRQQKNFESVEDYSNELKRLYDKAYPTRPPTIRQEDLLSRFLSGLRDAKVRRAVEFVKQPNSIDQAVIEAVNYMESSRKNIGREGAIQAVYEDEDTDSDQEQDHRIGRLPEKKKTTSKNDMDKPGTGTVGQVEVPSTSGSTQGVQHFTGGPSQGGNIQGENQGTPAYNHNHYQQNGGPQAYNHSQYQQNGGPQAYNHNQYQQNGGPPTYNHNHYQQNGDSPGFGYNQHQQGGWRQNWSPRQPYRQTGQVSNGQNYNKFAPNRGNTPNRQRGACFNCGSLDHFRRDCPMQGPPRWQPYVQGQQAPSQMQGPPAVQGQQVSPRMQSPPAVAQTISSDPQQASN